MAKNKQGSYFGNQEDYIDADLSQTANSEDFIDDNLDYQDFLNNLNDENYYSQSNHNYNLDDNFNEDYLDDPSQDMYPNQDYSDYDNTISADSISETEAEEINALLKNINEKLERLENRKKREVANAPFYAPNTMPYVVIPNQSGNEVILNELAKLREENYRMQHSQEIQRQLNALKEELNAKLAALSKSSKEAPKQDQKQNANGQNALLEELQKLNKKIEQLEAKSKGEDLSQILELINRLEDKINSKSQEQIVKLDNEESLIDIINQIRNVSLKNDDVLAYIKSIRHALGLSAISHVNEDGEIDYSDLKEEYAEFKKIIATGNLYAKISAISKFNELIAELPVGVHEEIAADFFRIRNKVFGTVLTPEVAAELIYNSTAADKERDIYYYFELKAELDRADAYDLPQIAEKFLKLRNRLQNNQYVTYNQNLFNDLIEANNDYQYDQSDYAKERLERAKEIFSTLRIGDIVPINDYSKIRPTFNYRSISDKLNELQKLVKEKDLSQLKDLQAKLDSVIGEIKSTYKLQSDFNAEQINKILEEITAIKESIIALSEQRHQEVLQEIGELRQEFAQSNITSDLEYIKAQVLNLQEELQTKNINYDLILNAVNELKDQFSALSDYSDYSEYDAPAVTNENIIDEIRALKEQIYIQKGEIDPETLDEVRGLKELLINARKEESYQEIIEGLNKLQSALEQNAKAESQDYQTVLTSALEVLSDQIEQLTQKTEQLTSQDNEQLLKEIEALKAEIKAINIPTYFTEGNKVKINYAELQQQLDAINESINRLADVSANGAARELAINVFRDSMIEVLNEITNLKDEYIYQSEKNEQLSNEITAIKEQFAQYFEDTAQKTELALLNEINELKELISTKAVSGDNQTYQEVLNELNAIKEQLALNAQIQADILQSAKAEDNSQLLKQINELKENFLIGKADTDNTFIVETASIREQLNALKQTLDFEKISQDINDLKSTLQNNKPEIDIEAIRQIIKEELKAPKTAELAVSVAAIEKQILELKKELSRRQESDAQVLSLMERVASLLENQKGLDISPLASDIESLKKEIIDLKAQKEESVSEESQRFAKRLTDLKEDLSKIAKIADLENIDALKEAVATEQPVEETETTEEIALEPEITDEDLSMEEQKELLKKSLLDSGLSEENAMEIINSIFSVEE